MLACGSDPAVVRLEVHADLEIPAEAELLELRVFEVERVLAVGSHALGVAPADRWPQVIPILQGRSHGPDVRISAEVRIRRQLPAPVTLGYGEVDARFSPEKKQPVVLTILRACEDLDEDGFGVGLGCRAPDCDDTNPKAPDPNYFECPDFQEPRPEPSEDGGSSVDAGSSPDAGGGPTDGAAAGDGALPAGEGDGGTPDEPDDAGHGPGDGATPHDAGPIDAGAEDGGAGSIPCGQTFCLEGEVCLVAGLCRRSCTSNEDCGDLENVCMQPPGACHCRSCQSDDACGFLGDFVCERKCCTRR